MATHRSPFVRALSLACLAALVAGSAATLGCAPQECAYQDIDLEDVTTPVVVDLRAMSSGVAVGSKGTILRYYNLMADEITWQLQPSPTDVELLGVAVPDESDTIFAVGAGGTLLRSLPEGWQSIDLGTTANLFAVTVGEARGAIVGDGVIFWTADGGETWQAASVPDGTGELRGVHDDGERMLAVGRAGTILSSDDAGASWTAIASPSNADLWAVGFAGDILIVGDQGTILRIVGDSAETVANSLGGVGALRALRGTGDGGYAVGLDGLIVDLQAQAGPAVFDSNPEHGDLLAVDVDIAEGAHAFLAVGAMGRSARARLVTLISDHPSCAGDVPGRPLRIAGEPCLAPVLVRDDWRHGPTPELAALDDALRERLAALWSRDAAFEHASVAAFARHALELMALAAPPELLAEVARAQLDELEHARLCFSLASAHAGRPLGPGGLVLDEIAHELTADPLAIARELFASGCLNETFAALEAARAAELADDPVVAAALERIAADEARHAALAWRTLAWLAGRDHAVARWLPHALGELRVTALPPRAADDALLASHGRVSAHERARLQRDAITTIVRPTLRALLRSHAADQAACASACH